MNYRILSLDGGGTWALIQVKALIALYGANKSGHSVLQEFDLVAANSGGGIVLGALVEDLTLGEILDFFESEEKRKSVFSKTGVLFDRAIHEVTGFGPKYSAKRKLPALLEVLPEKGGIPLNQVTKGLRRPGAGADLHLLIVSFDYDRNRATFFRSSPTSGPNWGSGETSDVTLAQAIHASTNAPVNYFDAPADFRDRPGRYWDGALTGCNNPVLAGVTEAIARQQQPDNIVALSLGTATVSRPWPRPGEPPPPFLQPESDLKLVTGLHKLATAILDDPPDAATYVAHVMTGSGIGLDRPPADSRIVRMNPLISPVKKDGEWSAPGDMTEQEFTDLANLDMDAVEQPQADAISDYADLWLQDDAPNQPIRMNGDTLKRELGQSSFSEAKAAWEAIR